MGLIMCKVWREFCVDDKGVRRYFSGKGLTRDFHRKEREMTIHKVCGRTTEKQPQILRLTTPELKYIPTPASKNRSPGTPGSGPRSLRMTPLCFVGERKVGERAGALSQVSKRGRPGAPGIRCRRRSCLDGQSLLRYPEGFVDELDDALAAVIAMPGLG
jgi:hypothetical protein